MTICCQLSNHCHCSLQLDDWILKEKNKKLNWNLQDSILRKKHWRTTEGLTVRVGRLRWSYMDGQKTDSKWHTLHWVLSFLGSFSSPVSRSQVSSGDWIPCQFLHFSPFRWSWCWPGPDAFFSILPDYCSKIWCSGTIEESAGGPLPVNKAQITRWLRVT